MFNWKIEFYVGVFALLGALSLAILAYKVSNFADTRLGKTFSITAEFDNIGGLKTRAPVSVGGVRIGEVEKIYLEPNSLRAIVSMKIDTRYNNLPSDSTIRILTAGLLGSNYISIEPGFNEDEPTFLTDGSEVQEVHSAIILENLIGQFLFSLNSKEDSK